MDIITPFVPPRLLHIIKYFNENGPKELTSVASLQYIYSLPAYISSLPAYRFCELVLRPVIDINAYRDFLVHFIQKFSCVGLLLDGKCCKYIQSHCIYKDSTQIIRVVNVPKEFQIVKRQFLAHVMCTTTEITEPCNQYIIEDVSQKALQFVDGFTTVISKDVRLMDVIDIDIRRVTKALYFQDEELSMIFRDFFFSNDRNHFIDQLIEAGYEDWL